MMKVFQKSKLHCFLDTFFFILLLFRNVFVVVAFRKHIFLFCCFSETYFFILLLFGNIFFYFFCFSETYCCFSETYFVLLLLFGNVLLLFGNVFCCCCFLESFWDSKNWKRVRKVFLLMFHTKEGLNFYQKDTVQSTPETKQEQNPNTPSSSTPVKLGNSVLSEHRYKESKLKEVRDFLTAKDKKCCPGHDESASCFSTSCFNAFKDCSEQESSIRSLRMKFFHPRVSRKQRRKILLDELMSMTEVSLFTMLENVNIIITNSGRL